MYGERVETLVHREVEVTTYEADLAEFRSQFSARCGRLASELADLELEIAQLLHQRRPDDAVLRARLHDAEKTAGRRHEFEDVEEDASERRPASLGRRTPEAQTLYHAIARLVHPDLGRDASEIPIRHELMVQLNWLYTRGDTQGLHEMLQHFLRGTSAMKGADTGFSAYLARAITAMDRRIEMLDARLQVLKSSEDATLRDETFGGTAAVMIDGVAIKEGDPFDRLTHELQRRIGYTQQRLDQLRRPPGPR
jgi:hypothetical protein